MTRIELEGRLPDWKSYNFFLIKFVRSRGSYSFALPIVLLPDEEKVLADLTTKELNMRLFFEPFMLRNC
jgi:hypothetical protein